MLFFPSHQLITLPNFFPSWSFFFIFFFLFFFFQLGERKSSRAVPRDKQLKLRSFPPRFISRPANHPPLIHSHEGGNPNSNMKPSRPVGEKSSANPRLIQPQIAALHFRIDRKKNDSTGISLDVGLRADLIVSPFAKTSTWSSGSYWHSCPL